ncbi:amphi-Trp domain-containing protein [Streptacidiphilus sp. MAP5-3]|jgi:amphi-Trp domain-containing protein|uniref:amphi-Trp domain-containing protein n=1 Tax=unclassified Streptacidiphilus TaxID=2643834 RepID=UPI003518E728
MEDLKFEQKSTLSRSEAAALLTELASALERGGHVELELGPGVLTMHVPDTVKSEVEVEVGGGEVELEIELSWATAGAREAASKSDPEDTEE